jgi:predicted alpha-1,2-mannosidase
MYRFIFISALSLFTVLSSVSAQSRSYVDLVNPFVGTKNMGHTFPGATYPFGMVQLSPATGYLSMYKDKEYNKEVYRYCAGYQYDDSFIYGFAHTHFSGTGHSDLGDFLIMPTTGKVNLNPESFRSSFKHSSEKAKPGYYKVFLDDYNIEAEFTTTKRVGLHKYSFKGGDSANIILDMVYNIYNHEKKNVWTYIRVENDTLVTGYRQTNGWARNRTLYFAMSFSKPIKSYGYKKYEEVVYRGFWRKFNEEKNFPEMAGENIRAYFNFDTDDSNELLVKFALSAVSTEGAIKNMSAELPDWDFNNALASAQDKWERELSVIEADMKTEQEMETFYTAMYHTMLSPVTYSDVDGRYRGLDQNIHTADGFTNYTIFSLWDTYRALHPLYNLIMPNRNADMIKSMLAHYNQSVHKMLPIWSHYSNENWCMIGYHAVSVIADAVISGNLMGIDIDKVLEACVNTSNQRYFDGIGDYIDFGHVPADGNSSSVSKTLEYAYNDWCIAQIAKVAGRDDIYTTYMKRADSYKNLYDSSIGFMRPKSRDGKWRESFDPMDTHGQGFIEGNAWNYGLYVPQNIPNMVAMMGGKRRFEKHLDKLFTMQIEDKYIKHHEDITRDGIIGNYVHGNEPGHHIAYLYNYTNAPKKTQKRVRMIMDTMYSNGVDGLCGNDDAGQMSAWYIFSSLGFYPVAPGSGYYEIGSPLVKAATINLPNGNRLSIRVKNQAKDNVYVKRLFNDGKIHKGHRIAYNKLLSASEIVFEMSDK